MPSSRKRRLDIEREPSVNEGGGKHELTVSKILCMRFVSSSCLIVFGFQNPFGVS